MSVLKPSFKDASPIEIADMNSQGDRNVTYLTLFSHCHFKVELAVPELRQVATFL